MLYVTNSVRIVQQMPYEDALEWFGVLKIGGKLIHTVRYADDLVLLAKERKVLQEMIEKLIETGRR